MSAGATARNVIAPVMRWGYRLHLHGAHRCPRRGPLLVVAAHEGFLDATVIATCLPRPVDVLVDPGGLTALGGRLPGRIIVDEDEPGTGLREAVARLQAGGAVGAWAGEGRERAAGLLAARSGAAILPVAVLGGSGRHPGDPPRWRARVDVVVGEPQMVAPPADPLSRADILHVAETIRQRVADHYSVSRVRMGRSEETSVGGRSQPSTRGAGQPGGPAPDNGAL
jgi:1-acyl-sn-glycerol-3-phosphate acyltransferase